MNAKRPNQQLWLPFTRTETGEARVPTRQGVEAFVTPSEQDRLHLLSLRQRGGSCTLNPDEPPCTDPYARWCGRGRANQWPAPIPIRGCSEGVSPEQTQADITVLLLLAPKETRRSMVNLEFEEPVPSRL